MLIVPGVLPERLVELLLAIASAPLWILPAYVLLRPNRWRDLRSNRSRPP